MDNNLGVVGWQEVMRGLRYTSLELSFQDLSMKESKKRRVLKRNTLDVFNSSTQKWRQAGLLSLRPRLQGETLSKNLKRKQKQSKAKEKD